MNTELFKALFNFRRMLDSYIGNGWVVGGAVRDMLYGAPCKDIDILFQATPRTAWRYLQELATNFPELTDIRRHEYVATNQRPGVSLIASGMIEGTEVQFLASDENLENTIRKFDWNVCQFVLVQGSSENVTEIYDPARVLGLPEVSVPVETALMYLPKLLIPADYTKDPAKSLYRGFRFQEKLGLPFEKEGLVNLMTAAKMQAARAESVTRTRLTAKSVQNEDGSYEDLVDDDPEGVNCVYRREYA